MQSIVFEAMFLGEGVEMVHRTGNSRGMLHLLFEHVVITRTFLFVESRCRWRTLWRRVDQDSDPGCQNPAIQLTESPALEP